MKKIKKSLVIHMFGHALGLGHEHQRLDFWNGIRKYIDFKRMESDPRVNDCFFNKNELLNPGKKSGGKQGTSPKSTPVKSNYDPDSIMHFG